MKPFTYYQRIFCFQFDSGYYIVYSQILIPENIFLKHPLTIFTSFFLLVGLIISDQRTLVVIF